MSRTYIEDKDVPEDVAWSLRSIAESLEKLAAVAEAWAEPVKVVRFPQEMTPEDAEVVREAWARSQAHQSAISVKDGDS